MPGDMGAVKAICALLRRPAAARTLLRRHLPADALLPAGPTNPQGGAQPRRWRHGKVAGRRLHPEPFGQPLTFKAHGEPAARGLGGRDWPMGGRDWPMGGRGIMSQRRRLCNARRGGTDMKGEERREGVRSGRAGSGTTWCEGGTSGREGCNSVRRGGTPCEGGRSRVGGRNNMQTGIQGGGSSPEGRKLLSGSSAAEGSWGPAAEEGKGDP